MLILFNAQTRLRLQKWYVSLLDKEKRKIIKDIMALILTKPIPSSNFIEYKDQKIVYQR